MGGVTAVQAEYIQTELCGRGMSNVWADRFPTSSSAMTSRSRKTLRVSAAVTVTVPPVERKWWQSFTYPDSDLRWSDRDLCWSSDLNGTRQLPWNPRNNSLRQNWPAM